MSNRGSSNDIERQERKRENWNQRSRFSDQPRDIIDADHLLGVATIYQKKSQKGFDPATGSLESGSIYIFGLSAFSLSERRRRMRAPVQRGPEDEAKTKTTVESDTGNKFMPLFRVSRLVVRAQKSSMKSEIKMQTRRKHNKNA